MVCKDFYVVYQKLYSEEIGSQFSVTPEKVNQRLGYLEAALSFIYSL